MIDEVNVEFTKFKLDNGLTVIVHEDRNSPLVAVNVQYRVGSKDEPRGKTGFAHLFEHLMCGGSENLPGSSLNHFNRIGATELNACTGYDSTNYFETVPTHALDFALFAESDRMGRLAISQETLDLQRGVVLNEKLQREGAPYGLVSNRIFQAVYPEGHPYAHPVIGSVEDIENATLADVRNWFGTYYGPANAVLTLAGDIDAATAKAKVERYFGDLPPGPPLSRPLTWIARRSGEKREVLEDRVPHGMVVMVWNTPPAGEADASALLLTAMILGGGPLSRLHQRLVEREQLAVSAGAAVMPGLIGGQFHLTAVPLGDTDLPALERVLKEELQRFIVDGPSSEELERVRREVRFTEIRGLASLHAIADLLGRNEVFHGDPGRYRAHLAQIEAMTAEDVRRAAREWLSDGVYTLHVAPFTARQVDVPSVDRNQVPSLGEPPAIHLPRLHEGRLSNGIRVLLAERNELPLIECKLLVPGGAIQESAGRVGVAGCVLSLMGRGAGSRDAADFAEATQEIGMGFGIGSSFNFASAHLSAFRSKLDASLDLFANAVLIPRFEEAEVQRFKVAQLQQLSQELAQPGALVGRLAGSLMYGPGHPYGRTPASATLAAITRDDVVEFHRRLYRPEAATFIVVGNVSLEELLPKLESRFGSWSSSSARTAPSIATVRTAAAGIYLLDFPGVSQSVVAAHLPAPAYDVHKEHALGTALHVVGGGFASRINMNIREGKHWTYGVSGGLRESPAERVFNIVTSVQADRTADTLREIHRELSDVIGPRPIDLAELRDVQDAAVLSAPAIMQTMGGVLGAIEMLLTRGLPLDHWSSHVERIRSLETAQVNAAAKELIDPARVVWVVAGDRRLIERELLDLRLGPVIVVDGRDESLYVGDIGAPARSA